MCQRLDLCFLRYFDVRNPNQGSKLTATMPIFFFNREKPPLKMENSPVNAFSVRYKCGDRLKMTELQYPTYSRSSVYRQKRGERRGKR